MKNKDTISFYNHYVQSVIDVKFCRTFIYKI